jgi:hypothetical protein
LSGDAGCSGVIVRSVRCTVDGGGHDRVPPHDGSAVENCDAGLVGHLGGQGRDRLVGSGGRDRRAGGDHVARPYRREEAPRHLEEDAARTGQLLRDECVEQARGDAALDDAGTEPARGGEVVVVVDRVAVAGDLGEEHDVALLHRPGPRGSGADR